MDIILTVRVWPSLSDAILAEIASHLAFILDEELDNTTDELDGYEFVVSASIGEAILVQK